MKYRYLLGLALMLLSCAVYSQELISADNLEKDYIILKQALEELHPGLYKYVSEEEMEKYFEEVKVNLSQDQDILSVYKEISLFTAKIQCGHTYCNFWNQPVSLRKYFTSTPNKVPFTFRIIDGEAYIYQDLSSDSLLTTGSRIISINGVAMQKLLTELKSFVKADGANDGKRMFDLQLFALDNYEAFDIYLPFVLDLDSNITIKLEDYSSGLLQDFEAELLTRKERFSILTKRYGKQIESYDEYWDFTILENNIGYLKVGTFVTWKMQLNWRKFLDDVFKKMQDQQINNLIIDIRGNEGGNTDVQTYLQKKLRKKNSQRGPFQQTLSTNYVSDEIRPYLKTWSGKNFDLRKKTVRLNDGFYTFKSGGMIEGTEKAANNAYTGKVYLLADPFNSSGTFFLINYVKNNGLATIVGQVSGGNQQGITGGQTFMLTLPYSGVEVDIPVIGYYPPESKPNKGIEPDVEVRLTVEDLVNGRDVVQEKAIEMIGKE